MKDWEGGLPRSTDWAAGTPARTSRAAKTAPPIVCKAESETLPPADWRSATTVSATPVGSSTIAD
eukprot:11068376-Alexandrium_andersonii.AAC.1